MNDLHKDNKLFGVYKRIVIKYFRTVMKEALTIEQIYQDELKTRTIQVDNIKDAKLRFDITDLKPGHRIFEFEVVSGMVQPAIVAPLLFTEQKRYVEFVPRPGCKYIPALNAENAYRKLVNREKAKNARHNIA